MLLDIDYDFTLEAVLSRIHHEDKDMVSSVIQNIPETPFSHEMYFRIKGENEKLIHIYHRFQKITNENNEYLMGSLYDITKLKEAENDLLRMKTNYFKMERMNIIKQFASGLVHDIRNILSVIINASELTKIHSTDEIVNENMDIILRSTHMGTKILNDLLQLTHEQQIQMQKFSVNQIIENHKPDFKRLTQNVTDLKYDLSDDLPLIMADEHQIYQILINLIINAKDAIKDTGEICISTSMVTNEAITSLKSYEKIADEYVKISVIDSGSGIAEDDLERVFEPFYTTKESSGTGLGLTIVQNTLMRLNGFSTVESKLGEGTTINVFIPVFVEDNKISATFEND
ncbi:MAG: hypothetical protein INQ03_17135 [Candidatus Heimdallarchaeota archaeon]|nr:hypothetical protein [Candidatus Heimdallarchaeota archaeon]